MRGAALPRAGCGRETRAEDPGPRRVQALPLSPPDGIAATARHVMILRRESAALLALLLACCETPKTALEVSREQLQHGNVQLAFHTLKVARDMQMLNGSVDPALEAEYQSLRIRSMLED